MKYLSFCFTSLLIIIGSTSCEVSSAPEGWDRSLVEAQIMESFEAYVNHVNTIGLKGADNYFSDDERFYWVEDGVIQYPNHDALVKGIEEFAPAVTSVDLKVIEAKVDALTQASGMIYVEYKQDLKLASGYTFTLDGAMTILMTKEDAGWKFLMGHSSIKKPRDGS